MRYFREATKAVPELRQLENRTGNTHWHVSLAQNAVRRVHDARLVGVHVAIRWPEMESIRRARIGRDETRGNFTRQLRGGNHPMAEENETPVEDLLAGNAFRATLLDRADFYSGHAPLWHGWAIMDAYLAGLNSGRKQAAGDVLFLRELVKAAGFYPHEEEKRWTDAQLDEALTDARKANTKND